MIKTIAAIVSALSMLTCVVVPVLHFQGAMGTDSFRQIFAVASVGWFVAATTWAARRNTS